MVRGYGNAPEVSVRAFANLSRVHYLNTMKNEKVIYEGIDFTELLEFLTDIVEADRVGMFLSTIEFEWMQMLIENKGTGRDKITTDTDGLYYYLHSLAEILKRCKAA